MISPFTENIVRVSEQVLFVFWCIIRANNIKSFAQDDVGIAVLFVWKILCIYHVIHALFYAYISVFSLPPFNILQTVTRATSPRAHMSKTS